MENVWSRNEQELYAKRMDEENHRQNQRIEVLDKALERNNTLLISVEKLATNMENMQKELCEQNKRLKELENRDGEMWRKVTGYVITAAIGIIVGFIFNQFGM